MACYAVRVVDQEPRGEKTAIEQLQYLKDVFSEEGAEGVGEQLRSMDINALRTVTSAAGLSCRAGGKLRSAAELRSALKDHLAGVLGANGDEQAGNHDLCPWPASVLARRRGDASCSRHVAFMCRP